MNEQEIKKILNEQYDETRENSLSSMLRDFYNRKMSSIVILVWILGIIFITIAVICAMQFFKTDQIKSMILYATIFVVCAHWVDLMKIFAWQMIHRNSIKRELKRLELRIAEMSETLKNR